MAKMMYMSFFLKNMARYLGLMNNIVNQITTHMGLRFLFVKDKAEKLSLIHI